MPQRFGLGYDSHRFGAQRPLILAGVTIEHESGLVGHSDGDAICHALTDAILGAAALGDIGSHFPDSDPKWAGADSTRLLRAAAEMVRSDGYEVVNVDATVVTEAPRIGPHVEKMRDNLAAYLSLSRDAVSIKAKSNEGMDSVGQGKGLAVFAVASLSRD